MIQAVNSWWIASVADLTTLKILRQDIDAIAGAGIEQAHDLFMERNPLKPQEILVIAQVGGNCAEGLCRSIRDMRTRQIVSFRNLVENCCQ